MGNQENQQPLQPGTPAPDFTLQSTSDQAVSLHDFRGQPVILVFYPADFSTVCTDQLTLYNQLQPEFKKFHAEMIGISVDSVWSHKAFSEQRHLQFPLLADFHPKAEVGKMYGVYDDVKGREERALFVIGADGIIRWSYVSPKGVNPGADGILQALEELQQEEKAHG